MIINQYVRCFLNVQIEAEDACCLTASQMLCFTHFFAMYGWSPKMTSHTLWMKERSIALEEGIFW